MIYALYNPLAGNQTCEEQSRKLCGLYGADELTLRSRADIDYAEFFSAISADDKVIICGGDGTLNRFVNDTDAELELIRSRCRELGVNVALSEVWAKGGEGGLALADEVVRLCENGDEAGRSADTFQFSYGDDLSLREKIEAVAKNVYRADGVDFEAKAAKELAKLEKLGFGDMPVCMAKTQYSFSDDQTKLGAPRGFRITVRDAKVSAGAGFVVALTGNIMTMPGLGKSPAAFKIDVDETGKITGLF